MTEYWVSQAKHYCKYCNMWMQDNKLSRANHDNGVKHKERVEQFNKKKRDEKLHGMRSEQDLKKQMNMIERAARAAMTADRDAAHGVSAAPPRGDQPADMPSSNISSRRTGAVGQAGFGVQDRGAGPAAANDLRQDSSGIYTVRGVTYYEGQVHEDKLRTGVECEIFVEAEDEWLPARILSRKEFPIPYTDRVQLVFDIRYSTDLDVKPSDIDTSRLGQIDESDAENTSIVTEKDVTSDRLRLMEAADGSIGEAGLQTNVSLALPVVPVEESTGLGLWQTVSVQTVAEEEDRLRVEAVERELELERAAVSAGRKTHLSEEAGASADAGDVLKAYDPYNRGMYKGIQVSRESTEIEIESLANGKAVSFKKRKVNSGASVSLKKTGTSD